MSASLTLPAARSGASLGGTACAVLVTLPLALLISWPHAVEVWRTGSYFDSDDALRMVQVRDWLAGQGWYDLVEHRLAPPTGLLMHWSRVVDVPLAFLVRFFDLFVDRTEAERLARLVFPGALEVAMVAATAFAARVLAGRPAVLPAAALILLSGISFGQFQPGRIDHHAPQILLLMLATGTTLLSLEPRKARFGALTGLLIALSLAISLEDLPFFAVLLTVPPLAWCFGGQPCRAQMTSFALGLGAAVPVFFGLTTAPARWTTPTADALSIAHVVALLLGALGLLTLGALTSRLPRVSHRGLAIVAFGMVLLGFVALAFPMLLQGPYAGIDPLVRQMWLDHVQEAQPITWVLADHPSAVPLTVGPLAAGLGATIIAAWRRTGLERGRWVVILALLVVGLLGSFWEFRVVSSFAPLALLAGAWTVANALDLARRSRPLASVLPVCSLFLFSAMAWALLPLGSEADARPESQATAAVCREAASWAALADLPAVTAFAPVDTGSYILAYTKMAAIGAPYHRNGAGNLTVLHALLAKPEAAQALIEGAGARLLLVCPGNSELKLAAAMAPDGLAAALLADRVPAWLSGAALPGTPYRVYWVGRHRPAAGD